MILSHKLISLLLLLIFLTLNLSNSTKILCFQTERKALLSFKQHLKDPHGILSSWVAGEEDCCKWYGIVCDNSTGHVQELRLAAADPFGEDYRPLQGKINPSLLDLKQLSHLILSNNDFEGVIPHQLGNLSSLRHLDLRYSYKLDVENLHWLSSLSSLEYLDMTWVNLSKASDHWLSSINNLPSLLELHLRYCELGHIHPLSYTNFSSLSVLDISENNFNSFIPDWVFSLSSLVKLDLSSSQFIGSFPNGSFSLTSLTSLYAYENSLSGNIPSYFYCFSNLKSLDLSINKLQGVVSNSIQNLTSLVDLTLGGNALVGELPASMGDLCNLQSIDLSYNKLNGSLPEILGSLSNLLRLDISNNLFDGVVSEVHFENLTNLRSLMASKNSLSLRVNSDWIPPFHLDSLDLGSLNLGSPQFPTWLKSQKGIREIDLSNTGISEAIPMWFLNLSTSFDYINLCHNQIGGEIPSIPPSNDTIHLCSNKFRGPIPSTYFHVWELDLSYNSLSGDISESLCHPIGDSRELTILRLGGNLLSGNIPDCWMYYPSLKVIDLSNNKLTGAIPNSMGSLYWLSSLHLHNNSLSGEIPSSLRNCTELSILDLGMNKFVGSIPNWIGIRLTYLMILIIRSNKLNDHIPIELCRLMSLQIFDAANNNLSGTIPRCFNNFSQMATKNKVDNVEIFDAYKFYSTASLESAIVTTKGREDRYDTFLGLVTSLDLSNNNLSGEIPKQLTILQGLWSLNLSRNHLRGRIPDQISNMTSLETLDLSRNKLSGNIPPSISSLTFLSHLNLSYNNLSGEIPLCTQLQTLDNSSFIGNQLCGPPLTKNCHEKNNTTHKGTEHGEGLNGEEEYWFHLGIAMGFVVGFFGIIAPLLMCRIWRRAYYWFWQDYILFKIVGWFIDFKNMLRI